MFHTYAIIENLSFQATSQLTENVSATFLFGCIGVWLEHNVVKLQLKRFVKVVESLCLNQPIENVNYTFDN